MRLLHTSDWHLGIHHGVLSRDADHALFLTWLLTELETQHIDTLVVAGDIFDSKQPSAQALGRYYSFLGRVRDTGVAQVLIIGGNHDSGARLDAPAEMLGAMQVHVVGGLPTSEAAWERCVVPLQNRAGETCAVALAVPYVHEFRLGVRTTDSDYSAMRAAFEQRFGRLYSHLTDIARARHPGLPIMATGHLTLGTAKREDYPYEIHQVGMIDGLPTTVLDSRIQYTALGHIHRSYPVGPQRRAWYSGSPIAFDLAESQTSRKVLRVILDADPDGQAEVVPVVVPAARALLCLRGEPDALLAEIRGLTWTEPLPPLLFCRVVADALPTDMPVRIHEALATFVAADRPGLAEQRQERVTPLVVLGDEGVQRPLEELEPAEVFETLCRGRGLEDTDALMRAFASVAGLVGVEDAELEPMLARIVGGEA